MNQEIKIKKQSKKTLRRIDAIKESLICHKDDIHSVKSQMDKYYYCNKPTFAPRPFNAKFLPISRQKFEATLVYLKEQVLLLENELRVLSEYGK